MQKKSGQIWFYSINIVVCLFLVLTLLPQHVSAQIDQPVTSESSPQLQDLPPVGPMDIKAIQVGPTQVDLFWTVDSPNAKGFRIERSTDPAFFTDVTNFLVDATVNTYSDTTVTIGVTYFYRVFAFNDIGDSLPSNPAIVFVASEPPPVLSPAPSPGDISTEAGYAEPTVSTAEASNITEKSATLNGSLSDAGSADQVLVYFEWGTDYLYGNISDRVVMTEAGPFSALLKNLRPGVTYHYRAVAVGKGVGIVYGSDTIFITADAVPEVPPVPAKTSEIPPLQLKTTALINAEEDSEIKSPSLKITLKIPKGAVSSETEIEIVERQPVGSTGMRMLNLFELNATDTQTKAKVTNFAKDLAITIDHDGEDLSGLDLDSLHLYYLDEGTGQWLPANTTAFDKETKSLTATTNHFTLYGEQANPLVNGPGRVMASQVNLHSGTSIFSYPFELPPGPGGFKPKLELAYNSGSADEMKNKRDVGSWVGIGWTLNLGRISQDLNDKRYYLELNGASYEIVSSDGTNFYTMPDQHFKMTRSGNTWELLDTSGYYFRFGGTTDSEQYVYDTARTYYRWDLSLMRDTNNNSASVTYTRDVKGTNPTDWVRSAYPEYLRYNNNLVEVHFFSSFSEYDGTDGWLRYDNPKTYGLNPAPTIMENKKLDSIEIKVNSSLIRKYAFAYTTTNRVYYGDYGGIYYAGKHTLTSITQYGANGTSTLPAMTFTYEDKQTYLLDSQAVQYTGNPGNATSFTWPHLTTISSGYGGTVTFAYTQIPTTSTNDMWTREVVTTKTVNPGTGTTQTYTYSYTGNPQYFINDGNEWDAKFRGFSQVRETDSAGNYVEHYFNTIDPFDGDAEKLTGLETKTEWYSSGGVLLRKVENTWGWDYTVQAYSFMRKWGGWSPIGWFRQPMAIARSNDGYVYVADTYNHRIQKFTSDGTFVTNWGSQGSGDGQFYAPISVATGSDGYVYVLEGNRIQKFTGNGTFVSKWGSAGSGDGQFGNAKGITVGSDGYVYVADYDNNRVQKFSNTGTFVAKWGSQGSGNGQFNYPYDVVMGSDGNIFVTDTYNHRIQKFTAAGTYLSQWGTQGSNDGQFNYPKGISASSDGNIYVADGSNSRVQKFTNTGTFVTKWGSAGGGDGQFSGLNDVAAGNDGYVYTAEYGNHRIQKFSNTGTFVTKWGSYAVTLDGHFNYPSAVAISNDGYVYVADRFNQRIQKFKGDGTFAMKWGSYGTGDGQFSSPQGIAVASDGYVYVADTSNHRIQKFTNTGTFVTKWGSYGSGDGQFNYPWGISVGGDGSVYVADRQNNRIQKFTSAGTFVTKWGSYGGGDGQFYYPQGVSAGSDGYIYVADSVNHRIQKFTNLGTFVTKWGSYGSGAGQFNQPWSVSAGSDGYVYVADYYNYRIQKFNNTGAFVYKWGSNGNGEGQFQGPAGIAVGNDGYVYVADESNNRIQKFQRAYSIRLSQVDTTTGSKIARTRYIYDSYGNVVTEYQDGDTSINTDNATVQREFYPNTTANILNKVAREWVTDYQSNTVKESRYYYDNNNSAYTTPPVKGNLTRLEQKKDASSSVSSYFTYDTYGNKLTEQDPNGNTTTTTYDTTYHAYPATKTYPITSLAESYTYDPGTGNLLTLTDVNGQVTTYGYDTFKRLTSVDKPLGRNPDVTYDYLDWGTLNQQRIYTRTYYDSTNFVWQKEFFDGLGRVIQTHNSGEPVTTHVIVSRTTTYNSRGLVDKQYVSQDITSTPDTTYYQTPQSGWKYTTYAYDGLSRVTQQINADATWVTHDLSTAWQDTVTNERGYDTSYYFDAFNRLSKVQEPGNDTYSFLLKWGEPHALDGQFDYPYKVAVDSSGNIYVANAYDHRIQKFDSSGTFITKWGTYGTGDGQFNYPLGVAVDGSGNVYVADTYNNRIQKFDSSGTFITKWGSLGSSDGQFNSPYGVAADSGGNVYVADSSNHRIQKFDSSGTFLTKWGSYGSGDGQFKDPRGVAADGSGNIYVADTYNHRIQKFNSGGTFITKWGSFGTGEGLFIYPYGVAVDGSGNVYVADTSNHRIQKFDSGGTFITKWGAYGTGNGQFYSPCGVAVDSSGYVYVSDTNNHRIQKFNSTGTFQTKWGTRSGSADGQFYDPSGVAVDGSSNVYVADTKNHRIQKFDASGTFVTKWGSLGSSDGQFNSPYGVAVDGSGNVYVADSGNHRVQKFNANGAFITKWGTYGTGDGQFSFPYRVAVDGGGNVYVADSGNHRIQKFNSSGTFITKWGSYGTGNGQFNYPYGVIVEGNSNVYVADSSNHRIQKFDANGTFITKWGSYGTGDGQFSTPYGVVVDGSGNVYVADTSNHRIQKFDANGTFTTKWGSSGSGDGQFKDPRGVAADGSGDVYVADTKNHRIQKFDHVSLSSANTNYSYDVLGNLKTVTDAAGNITSMNYDWLSRKTSMSDPDMGTWYYKYDSAGNLASQVDQKAQATNMYYDALNRLKGKTYTTGVSDPPNYTRPPDPGSYTVGYTYDAYDGSTQFGKGRRTGMIDAMSDAAHPSTYKYDRRGRLTEEKRWEYSNSTWNSYTTSFAYDGADRPLTVTYPGGETATQGYNGRGLPNTLTKGSSPTSLVSNVLYNQLGAITQINLGNGLTTYYGYWGFSGTYDNPNGYYGRLYKIKTGTLQEVNHIWDAGGNLLQRYDVVAAQTENFGYDTLDRLVSVFGAYSETYTYNAIGNIMSKNGVSYTYGDTNHKHAVTAVGSTSYAYDANGNMTTRGSQTITWDIENRPVTISGGASFVYDGDGNRVKKTENGETILYVNKYYEKNLTTSVITTSYYLGGKLIAQKEGSTQRYVHQDRLSGTSVMSDTGGASLGSISYYPFGTTRSGSVPTDKKFTGQRLDSTGLYYYNARYYDPSLGRFISADTIVPSLANPQSLNRYSYVLNNPLKYADPSGHLPWAVIGAIIGGGSYTLGVAVKNQMAGKGFNLAGWRPAEFGLNVALGALTGGVKSIADRAVLEGLRTAGEAVLLKTSTAMVAGAISYKVTTSDKSIATASENLMRTTVNLAAGEINPLLKIPANVVMDVASNLPATKDTVGIKEYVAPTNVTLTGAVLSLGSTDSDSAYNAVAVGLGANQTVAYTSGLGYHAVDVGSEEYKKFFENDPTM